LVSLALVPVFSSNFHSATGALHVDVSPGTQYSRLAAFDAVAPSDSVERAPRTVVFPWLYSSRTSSASKTRLYNLTSSICPVKYWDGVASEPTNRLSVPVVYVRAQVATRLPFRYSFTLVAS